jgi:hypothetical protein
MLRRAAAAPHKLDERRMRRLGRVAVAAVMIVALGACSLDVAPTASQPPSRLPTAAATATVTPTPTPTPDEIDTREPSPTATPEPPLSLELPQTTDERVVSVAVAPDVGAEGGTITVSVTSEADTRIDELVLRWPTELGDTLFLAPFVPSAERIREGGPPLVQVWTKWVIGPGEQGEPEGTISLGYGPLLPGATLEIPIFVVRRAEGAVAFDLQVLAGNDVLTLDDGEPAEIRVEVP